MLYKVNWTDHVEKKQRAPGILVREEKYPNIAFKSLQECQGQFCQEVCVSAFYQRSGTGFCACALFMSVLVIWSHLFGAGHHQDFPLSGLRFAGRRPSHGTSGSVALQNVVRHQKWEHVDPNAFASALRRFQVLSVSWLA